ncbi:MAG: porin [Vicinamibacterales bacterium]
MRLRRSSSSPSGKRALSVGPARALAMIGAMVGVMAAQPSYAQTNVSSFFEKVTFSGLVDAYYTYNFNKPAVGEFTPLRNFDVRHNQFSVALLEFAMEKPAVADDRIGFRFDLQYGQVAQIFNSDPLDNNALVNVQQAYLSYLAPVGKGLTIDVGKFVTPIGYEPTEAHLNNNYSRAFWYALGPYYHVGARFSYPVHEKLTLGAMLVNGWNATGDNNSGKSVGASATFTPHSKITIVQNILYGPEQAGNNSDKRTYSDTNFTFAASDTISTGFNYVYAKDSIGGTGVNWNGIVLYFRDQLTPIFAVAPRFEIFNDNDGMASGTAQKLKEFTLTGELKHSQGLIFRAEYRRDWSDIDYFVKDGIPRNNQNTFTLAFIVPFSSKS